MGNLLSRYPRASAREQNQACCSPTLSAIARKNRRLRRSLQAAAERSNAINQLRGTSLRGATRRDSSGKETGLPAQTARCTPSVGKQKTGTSRPRTSRDTQFEGGGCNTRCSITPQKSSEEP